LFPADSDTRSFKYTQNNQFFNYKKYNVKHSEGSELNCNEQKWLTLRVPSRNLQLDNFNFFFFLYLKIHFFFCTKILFLLCAASVNTIDRSAIAQALTNLPRSQFSVQIGVIRK